MGSIAVLIPFAVISIPIIAIIFEHIQKSQKNKIKELEVRKEILKLEIDKQNGEIKLLEEENKKLDKIIYESR